MRLDSRIVTTYVGLAAANVAAWAWAWMAFRGHPALLGTALLAYVFGLRHAVDADHIAAIDNVVRKLVQQGERAENVGLFFSLGHSTVVVLASFVIAATAAAFSATLERIATVGAAIGTATSACFLVIVGLANLVILRGVWRTFVRVRNGESIADLETVWRDKGVLTRLFSRFFRLVTRAGHMYPLGFLFGLGFDTATEIGVLGISATSAAGGLGVWHVMVFPALFTAAMTLVDTTDSVLMVRAYCWAFVRPTRKLWYNLTMTGASVAVALLIGGVEALGIIGGRAGFDGPFWQSVEHWNDDLGSLGFAIIAVFLVSWAVSLCVYRWKRFDDLAPIVRS